MVAAQKKRPRGRPKALDRDRTVDAAMACYWREGVNTLGLNEICRRMGISKPSLYREFGGEDGLMVEALNRYRDEVGTAIFDLLKVDLPFPEVLQKIVTWFTEDNGKPAGCLFASMRYSPSRLGPLTMQRVAVLRDEHRAAYEAWYERARVRNEVNPDIPSKLAAMLIDTQLTSLVMQMTLGEPPDSVRAQAELALRCLLPHTKVS